MNMELDWYPIEQVREEFPALQRIENDHFVAYFDGPGGTQVARSVIEAIATYMKNGVANLGGVYPTSKETVMIVDEAREHVAILLGTNKKNIAFGANMTSLAFKVARAISRDWDHGNIVVTEIDHHANVDPWVTAAVEKDLTVNKITLNKDTKTLNYDQLTELINEETKLVAIGLASNAIGTINDCQAVINRAKEVGALVAIDGVHAVPHFSVDFTKLGADFLFCSAYKFFGPHVGVVAIHEDVFDKLEPYKLEPAPDETPEKLETGTLNFEGLVGVTEAIKFIASIGEGNLLREQLDSAYRKMTQYEDYLANRLRSSFAEMDHVILHQAGEHVNKTPTVAFQVEGMEAEDVCTYLQEKYALHLEYGNFYAKTLVEKLNVKNGGLVRAGIAPYNTVEEIDRLIEAVKEIK